MAVGGLHHAGGAALGDDLAAVVSAFGAKVENPVGGGDDVQVVFNDQQAVAGGDELAQHGAQAGDVRFVQADGGFVQNVQRAAFALRCAATGGRAFGQFCDELDALRFAAGERRAGLAEGEITQAHVVQKLQRAGDGAVVGEEFARLRNGQRQKVCDVVAAPAHAARVFGKARAAAGFAGNFHVRQKTHFSGDLPLAEADRAAPVAGVEGKAGGVKAAHARFRGAGEQFADAVPKADVGGRTRARRFANRGLVDFQHTRKRLPADKFAAVLRVKRCPASGAAGQRRRQIGQQDVARQRRFAGAGNAGEHH